MMRRTKSRAAAAPVLATACTTHAAVRAVLQVELEHPLEQPRPTQPHGAVMRAGRLALGRLSTLALWLLLSLSVHAGVISAGPVTSTVPAKLVDPLGSLSGGLSSTQFLVPIIVTGAIDLQFWSFDLAFDSTLVIPLDVGGLFQQVYQAEFDDGFITNIESSGFLLDGVLEGISGSAPTVSGDGPLAYVLFQLLPTVTVAEPESILLALPVLLALGWRHRRPQPAQPA